MSFREIAVGSEEYRLECRLREKVLRRPLGVPLRDEDVAGEEIQLHFGIFGPDDDLRACVVARPLSPREARIRQMAVSPAHQRTGLGRRLMAGVEDILKARGFERIVLDARTSAAGFYERLGYVSAEDEFVKLGVPHVKMSKDLR